MLSYLPGLTIHNVAFLTSALYTEAVLTAENEFGIHIRDSSIMKKFEVIGALSLAGITAVVIKEGSYESSTLAIIISLGVFILFSCYPSHDPRDNTLRIRIRRGLCGVTNAMLCYAIISTIVATGAKIANFLSTASTLPSLD